MTVRTLAGNICLSRIVTYQRLVIDDACAINSIDSTAYLDSNEKWPLPDE